MKFHYKDPFKGLETAIEENIKSRESLTEAMERLGQLIDRWVRKDDDHDLGE